MKIDAQLKEKVLSYISKNYSSNEDGYVINDDKILNYKMFYDDVIDIFGLDEDFAYAIVVEWLFTNEFTDIQNNWLRIVPYQMKSYDVYPPIANDTQMWPILGS